MRAAMRRRSQYITGIDGLRTLAVLGVIIYHLLPNVLQGGYLGGSSFSIGFGLFCYISSHEAL